MKKYSIRVILLLPFFVCTLFGSEKNFQSDISQQGAPCQGPIARATKLPALLVEIIVAFRGPVYVGGYTKRFHRDEQYRAGVPNTYLQIHEPKEEPHTIDVRYVLVLKTGCSRFESWEESFNVPNLSYRESGNEISDYHGNATRKKRKEASEALEVQKDTTDQVRENHGEIRISRPRAEKTVSAIESTNAVFSVTMRYDNKNLYLFKILEKWPLKYGDYGDCELQPKKQSRSASSSYCAMS